MPARTHATDPEGLMAAMIRPTPSTAAAAEPLVPTCSSIDLKDDTRTVPTAPPSSPMPIRSIPIRSTSGLTLATVYGGPCASLGLDSINVHSERGADHAGGSGDGPPRARRADHQKAAVDRGQDQGRARAGRPLGELRVPRCQERAGNDKSEERRVGKESR